MVSHFNIYATNHVHSQAVCSALARGTGFAVVPPAPLVDGGVVLYGFLRGLLDTLRSAQAQGRQWVYADRGYLRATYGNDHTGYFRLTRNAYQHDGVSVQPDKHRWEKLLLPIAPWRRGRHVLICPPGEVFAQGIARQSAAEWLDSTLAVLKSHTDRPVRVRRKPVGGNACPLAMDLQDCHALVTYMSNTSVEAVLAGVPVFATGRCAASTMGKSNLAEIESPAYPSNREQWAATLANNQWTLEEIKKGAAGAVFR